MTDDTRPPRLRVVEREPEQDPTARDEVEPEFDADPPSPDQIIETMAHSIIAQLPQAHVFAPHFPRDRLPEVAMYLANEQYKINTEILPRFADPSEPKPRFALKFATMPTSPRDAAAPRSGVVIETFRRLEGVTDPVDACRMAFVFAFLDSVVARAILRMNGYAYEFSFVGPERPRIVT